MYKRQEEDTAQDEDGPGTTTADPTSTTPPQVSAATLGSDEDDASTSESRVPPSITNVSTEKDALIDPQSDDNVHEAKEEVPPTIAGAPKVTQQEEAIAEASVDRGSSTMSVNDLSDDVDVDEGSQGNSSPLTDRSISDGSSEVAVAEEEVDESNDSDGGGNITQATDMAMEEDLSEIKDDEGSQSDAPYGSGDPYLNPDLSDFVGKVLHEEVSNVRSWVSAPSESDDDDSNDPPANHISNDDPLGTRGGDQQDNYMLATGKSMIDIADGNETTISIPKDEESTTADESNTSVLNAATDWCGQASVTEEKTETESVSYTHLTLPTKA